MSASRPQWPRLMCANRTSRLTLSGTGRHNSPFGNGMLSCRSSNRPSAASRRSSSSRLVSGISVTGSKNSSKVGPEIPGRPSGSLSCEGSLRLRRAGGSSDASSSGRDRVGPLLRGLSSSTPAGGRLLYPRWGSWLHRLWGRHRRRIVGRRSITVSFGSLRWVKPVWLRRVAVVVQVLVALGPARMASAPLSPR